MQENFQKTWRFALSAAEVRLYAAVFKREEILSMDDYEEYMEACLAEDVKAALNFTTRAVSIIIEKCDTIEEAREAVKELRDSLQ